MTLTLNQLAQRFGGRIIGKGERQIDGLAPLDCAGPHHLSFLTNTKYLAQVASTRAAAVLITEQDLAKIDPHCSCTFFVTPNPYATFARIAQYLAAMVNQPPPAGAHPSAMIDPTARVAPSASIGPYTVIEADAVIGERARLDAHVFIGQGATVNEEAHLYPQVTIYHGCTLGARVIVHAGAVIGSDGFGFAPDFGAENDPDAQSGGGEWVKIVQTGAVVIGDDVEVGANTTIDRGAMTNTVIEQGVKIDNLVQIAHNCRIGAYTVIAACTGIAGSTTIGRHCMIGGAVGVAGHLTLGDRVIITAKSGVSKSLPKAGVYTSAFPAIAHADWNRNAALMRNLDTLRTRIKQLEAAVFPAQRGDHPSA